MSDPATLPRPAVRPLDRPHPDRGGAPTVASPLHEQAHDLRTGFRLDLPGVTPPRYDVRCRDGLVEVGLRQEE